MGAGRGQARRAAASASSEFQHDMKARCSAIPSHMLQVSEALIFSKEDGHELQIGIFVDLGENHTSGEFQLNENEEPNARLISVIGSSHQQDGVPEIGEICPDFSSAAYRLGIATADATKSGYSSENEDFSLPDSVEEVAEHMLKKLKSSGPFAPDELKPLTF